MKDKYLGREGIIDKYDSRNFIANCVKYCGAVGGFGLVLIGLGAQDVRMMIMESGAGSLMYLVGHTLYRVNEKRKEKALKNLEIMASA